MLRSRLALALLCVLSLPVTTVLTVLAYASAIRLLFGVPSGPPEMRGPGEGFFFIPLVFLVPVAWAVGIGMLVAGHYRQLRRDREDPSA